MSWPPRACLRSLACAYESLDAQQFANSVRYRPLRSDSARVGITLTPCVCVCVCVCVYIYTCIYTHTHTNMYIYTCIFIYVYTYYIYTYTYKYVYVYLYIYICIYIYVYLCIYIDEFMRIGFISGVAGCCLVGLPLKHMRNMLHSYL